MQCFTVESYALRASLLVIKVLVYNKISVFIMVWLGGKIPDFAR